MRSVWAGCWGRGRWLTLFTLVLCASTAGPVLADSQPEPPATVNAVGDLSNLPDAHDVAEGIARLEQKEAKQQAELETSAALEERVESQQAYTDLSAEDARELFRSQFAEQLKILNSDPARFLSDAQLGHTFDGGTAALVSEGGSPELLEAGVPVEVENDEGVTEKVDLSIVDAGAREGFELANPLVGVAMPEAANESIEVGEAGLAITQIGASKSSTAQPLGDNDLFYASAQADTDLVVSPVAEGVELSNQLRSSESPETLRFQVDLPTGSELRADDNGGAKVVAGSKVLAHVPFPTAVDAQGAEVPVEMSVDGDELVMNVPHATGEFAYPIDVDPSLVEDWYNASWYSGNNLQSLSDGSWAWNPNTNWIYGSTSCIWTCWGSGRGLYISAESGWHGGYQQGQWVYGPPGGTSYISSGLISPFWRNNYSNCSASKYPQPHDYDGIWSEQYGWWPLETNRANNYGNANPSGYGKALIIGLGNAEVGAEDKCRRDIMAGGVAIWISDPEPPTWNSSPSVSDQWIDTTSIPVSASAHDPGLGMKYFNLWTTNSAGQNEALVGNAVHPCSGLHASPCPYSWSSTITNYSSTALPTGILKMNTVAYDALGIEHNSAAGPIFLKVDHLKPEISYSGELLEAHPLKYHLGVTGTDGNASSLATAQSGMKSLLFYVDGQLAGRKPETANPPACSNIQEGRNVGSCQFANVGLDLNRSLVGKHTIKIVAIDSLNHESEKTIEVTLPADTTAPTITPSGPLYTAASSWINTAETSVTASAQDTETGVVEEALYIDNKLVGSSATQECFNGGCSMSHTFNLSLVGYTEGSHTVKLIARDGGGKVGESSWTVKVDSAIPTITSISAPEVPPGWTPQLASFNLSYSAADSGSGVKKIEVSQPGIGGTTVESTPYNSACTGSVVSPCSPSVEGSTAISTTNMAQGVDTVTVKAYDAFNHVSSAKTLTVYVDREGPTVTPSGPLMTGSSSSLIGLVTKLGLNVNVQGAGVESVELQLDGQPVEAISQEEILASGGSQSCGGESCELSYNFVPVVGEAAAPGPHTVKLVVRDKAGHVSSVSHEVTLDTRPPELTLSGPLAEAAGEQLSTPVASLMAEAKDGADSYAAGLANLKIEVDGKEVFFESAPSSGGTPQEHMWVVDENNNRVQEFNEKGEFVNGFGDAGSGKGQFSRPTAVALDSKGSLWVTDAGNNRIEQFTEKGQFRRAVGSYGTGNAHFAGPEGIVVDSSGNVWVADTYNARIQELNEKGEFIQAFGTRGSGSGQLIEPTAIAIGPGGNIWVTDWGNNKVVEFKANGEFIRQFGSEGTGNGQFKRPDAIVFDGKGDVWVGDQNNERIQEFNQSGEYVGQFGTEGSGQGQFSFGYPMGIGVDSKGALWISDTGHNRLQKWSPGEYAASSIPTYVSSFGSPGSGNGQFEEPRGITIDPEGNLWVADAANHRIEEFDPGGEYAGEFEVFGLSPTAIAADNESNLWVSFEEIGCIAKFSPGGEVLTANCELSSPDGIAIDPEGNLWVADSGNDNVKEFGHEAELLNELGSGGSGPGEFSSPQGVAVDNTGNLWVTDTSNNRMQEWQLWQPSNYVIAYSSSFGSAGTGNGQFAHPAGLALGMTHGCVPPGCPLQQAATYSYDEAVWGTGPHEVVVTATDATGNTDTEEVHVNEPLNVVAPNCPTASPESLEGGEVRSAAATVSVIEQALPSAVEPSEPTAEEAKAAEEGAEVEPIEPKLTREPEGVSLDEQGIDVTSSIMGGGAEDQAAGSFTVGQAVCMQPLQQGTGAKAPVVVDGSAVVYPNAAPDTDTVVRPTALGTTIIEYLRGTEAPDKFRWALGLKPGEELVELENGDVAIVATNRPDPPVESVPSEPSGGWGPEELNSVEAQMEQAEHDVAMANNEVTGELTAVIAAPEVVLSSGEVVQGLLRVTPGNVVKAELPPGAFAEAEALIIKANPPAEIESICAAVLSSTPQYYPLICKSDLPAEANGQEDASEQLIFLDLAAGMGPTERLRVEQTQQRFFARYGVPTPQPIEIWEEFTEEEKAMCSEDWSRCYHFLQDGAKAAEIEDKVFNGPAGSPETKGNAFRHSAWVAFMEVTNHDDGDGLLWAEAHEGKEYANTAHPSRRKASQMDMMNDHVGWFDGGQYPKKQLTACADMLSKIGSTWFLGREVYPYRWGKNSGWAAYLPVFRQWIDWRTEFNGQPNPSYGVVIVRNGRTCPEVW